jgi:hypothetical protein
MTPEEYIAERVDIAIEWYSRAAYQRRKVYMQQKAMTLMCALFIPVLLVFSEVMPEEISRLVHVAATVASVLLAFLVGLQTFQNSKEKWASYRATSAALKREKLLFAAGIGKYESEENKLGEFVTSIEAIISREQEIWYRLLEAHQDLSPDIRGSRPTANDRVDAA